MDNASLANSNQSSTPLNLVRQVCVYEPDVCADGISLFRRVAILYGVILMLLILSLNVPIFISFLNQSRSYIRPSSLIKLSIGTSDILAACAYLPLLILALQRGENDKCDDICAALVTVEKAQIASSVWGIAMISFDRYMSVCKWDSYKTSLTLKKAYFMVTGVWILSCAIGAVSFFLSTSSRHITGECICHLSSANYGFFNMGFSAFFIACCFVLPSVITVVFNSLTGNCLCRHSNMSRDTRIKYQSMIKPLASHSAEDTATEVPGNIQKRKKLICDDKDDQVNVKLIVFLLCVYMVMVAPYFLVILVVSMGHWKVHSHPYYLHIISVLLFHTNSACNVLFYGYSNRQLRTTIVSCVFHKLGINRDCSPGPNKFRRANGTLGFLRGAMCRPISRAPSVRSEISILSTCSRNEDGLDCSSVDTVEGHGTPTVSAADIGRLYQEEERC